MEGDRIADISFDGSGCAISQASASLMTTQLKGKTAPEAEALFKQFHDIVTTGQAPEEISDLAAFAGVLQRAGRSAVEPAQEVERHAVEIGRALDVAHVGGVLEDMQPGVRDLRHETLSSSPGSA